MLSFVSPCHRHHDLGHVCWILILNVLDGGGDFEKKDGSLECDGDRVVEDVFLARV
ncbi:hypothetical protein PIB30_057110 [Stylosanthes scabra]|uniref:Uncharacterized protein n=1 Tax=Stylosanthes scabra TaxID=79078 RepID=A0ABU6YGZ0_9FABA|nr:hypothetical protein [Stylosanthes scabra]